MAWPAKLLQGCQKQGSVRRYGGPGTRGKGKCARSFRSNLAPCLINRPHCRVARNAHLLPRNQRGSATVRQGSKLTSACGRRHKSPPLVFVLCDTWLRLCKMFAGLGGPRSALTAGIHPTQASGRRTSQPHKASPLWHSDLCKQAKGLSGSGQLTHGH